MVDASAHCPVEEMSASPSGSNRLRDDFAASSAANDGGGRMASRPLDDSTAA
jgi:hypothetical protein